MGTDARYGSAIDDIVELGTPNLGVYCYVTNPPSLIASHYKLAPDQIRTALAQDEKYTAMIAHARLHAIVGTANHAEALILENIISPCYDSCETNDGFVNWTSATTIEYAQSGVSRSIAIPSLAVPYTHTEFAEEPTDWIFDKVIVAYFYASHYPFPSCTQNLSKD